MIFPFSPAGGGVERADHAGRWLYLAKAAAAKKSILFAHDSIRRELRKDRTALGCRDENRPPSLIEGRVLPVCPAADAGSCTTSSRRYPGNLRHDRPSRRGEALRPIQFNERHPDQELSRDSVE